MGEAVPGRCSNCPAALPGRPFDFVVTGGYVEPLASCSLLRNYRAGQFILREGEPADGLYVLRKGLVRIFLLDEEGREHTMRFAHPGDVIGGCQFTGRRRFNCYSVVAVSDAEVCHFPVASHGELLGRCPELARALLDVMAGLLDESYVRLRELASTNCRQRLARLLVRLAESHIAGDEQHRGPDEPVTIQLHRQRMADILGVTKETAVRALSSLKVAGLVETHGRAIVIRDLPALRRFCGLG
ncbi:MAG: Crp/Fnr family transcriptional regulator [Bacillota bacterium]